MTRNQEILQDFINGASASSLGRKHGVSRTRIYQIISKSPEYEKYLNQKHQRGILDIENARIIKSLSPYRKEREIVDRFWGQIDTSGECWEWTGCKNPVTLYGRFTCTAFAEKYGLAVTDHTHRQMWCIWNGKQIPKDMWVLHVCDNPSCVNPKHLYLGTPLQNVEDRQKRSGWKDFEKKLSENDRIAIGKIFQEEGMSVVHTLAGIYNVSPQYIYRLGLTNRNRE